MRGSFRLGPRSRYPEEPGNERGCCRIEDFSPAARDSGGRIRVPNGAHRGPERPGPAVVRGPRAARPMARDAARLAAPSSMHRSAAASPPPIARDRVRAPTTGDRLFARAGEMTRLASTARRRSRNSRASMDASTTSPSDSRPPPSGIAIRFAVAGSVARAVLPESLRRLLDHRDDLRITLMPRSGPHHISGAEHQQRRQPHHSLRPSSSRRRSAEIAALAAVAATSAPAPDLTALGGWMSDTADPTAAGSLASRAALTAFSNGVLRRRGLTSILSVASWLSARCARPS
jgi:hypothetical protein